MKYNSCAPPPPSRSIKVRKGYQLLRLLFIFKLLIFKFNVILGNVQHFIMQPRFQILSLYSYSWIEGQIFRRLTGMAGEFYTMLLGNYPSITYTSFYLSVYQVFYTTLLVNYLCMTYTSFYLSVYQSSYNYIERQINKSLSTQQ